MGFNVLGPERPAVKEERPAPPYRSPQATDMADDDRRRNEPQVQPSVVAIPTRYWFVQPRLPAYAAARAAHQTKTRDNRRT